MKESARIMCVFAVAGIFPLYFFSGFAGSPPNLSAIFFKMYFFSMSELRKSCNLSQQKLPNSPIFKENISLG